MGLLKKASVEEWLKAFQVSDSSDSQDNDNREEIQLVFDAIKYDSDAYFDKEEYDMSTVDEHLEKLEKNMNSIVLIVRKCDLESGDDDDHYTLKSMKLKDRRIIHEDVTYYISPSNRYAEQHSTDSLGTGFFVTSDLIVTAAHVLYPPFYKLAIDTDPSASDPETKGQEIRFVTNFRVTDEDAREDRIRIPKTDVFKPVAGEALLASRWANLGEDWAVIRVEKENGKSETVEEEAKRVVTGIRAEIAQSSGNRLYCMGHGFGLPLKIAFDSRIQEPNNDAYFECNLKTFSGNSGSPVFDIKEHNLVGILVRGDGNFVHDTQDKRYLSPRVNSREEECQTMVPIQQFLNELDQAQ